MFLVLVKYEVSNKYCSNFKYRTEYLDTELGVLVGFCCQKNKSQNVGIVTTLAGRMHL